MNYDELKAAELKALCEEKGIKPSRAKADMIEDLKAWESAFELMQHDQDAGLYDSLPSLEKDPVPEPQPEPEPAADELVWLQDGVLHKRYKRHGKLDEREHHHYLSDVIEEAVLRDFGPFGPSFRLTDPDPDTWVYGINVRTDG